jgi:hypothetical protein
MCELILKIHNLKRRKKEKNRKKIEILILILIERSTLSSFLKYHKTQ